MESWLQGFRRRKLSNLFGNSAANCETEVIYCDDEVHSQQNRCLVAGRLAVQEKLKGEKENVDESGPKLFAEFVTLLERQAERYAAAGLPADIRPKGLVSERYAWDGNLNDERTEAGATVDVEIEKVDESKAE